MRQLLVFCLVAAPTVAQAEIMDTSVSLRPGKLTLGAEAQAGILPGPYSGMVNLHEAVGLAGRFDLYARQGLSWTHHPHYFGAGLKFTLLHASTRRNRPGVAIWFGGHYYTGGVGGADGTIAIDYQFSGARVLIGLDSNLELRDDFDWNLKAFANVRIPVVKNIKWFVEGGFGLHGAPLPHYISTGPKLYL